MEARGSTFAPCQEQKYTSRLDAFGTWSNSCKIDAQISREAIVCATPSKKQSLSGMLWHWSKKEDRIIYRRLRECAASKVAHCVKAGRGAVAQSSFGRSRTAGSRRSTVWNRRRRPPMEIKAFAGLFGVGQHQPHPHATNHSTVHPS